MDYHSAVGRLTNVQEPIHDRVAGCGTILEVEVCVLETTPSESYGIVQLFVQPCNFVIFLIGSAGVSVAASELSEAVFLETSDG